MATKFIPFESYNDPTKHTKISANKNIYTLPAKSGYYKIRYSKTAPITISPEESLNTAWEDSLYRYDISYYDAPTDTWYDNYNNYLLVSSSEYVKELIRHQCTTEDMISYISALGFYTDDLSPYTHDLSQLEGGKSL